VRLASEEVGAHEPHPSESERVVQALAQTVAESIFTEAFISFIRLGRNDTLRHPVSWARFHLMDFDLTRIVEGKRNASAGYHFMAARGWRLFGEPKKLHSPLAYSAFEFRCSIERSLFELFVLIRNDRLTQADLQAVQRFSGLRNIILRLEGPKKVLHRKLLFSNLYARGIGLAPEWWPSVPDIGILEKYWSNLSEYCHRQLKPKATWDSLGDAWINTGYQLLNDVENYLWEITVKHQIGWFQVSTLPPEMIRTRKDFIDGKIDERSVLTRIQILEPAVQMRWRRRLNLR
jgi:hypothetical protein